MHTYIHYWHRPELYVTPFCNPDQHNLFQTLMGMLRWPIDLGWIDVQLETLQIPRFLASPRIGHQMQALYIIHYLQKHEPSWILMDSTKRAIEYKWSEEAYPPPQKKSSEVIKCICCYAQDEVADNVPGARGKSV